jgi:hypothetical protein
MLKFQTIGIRDYRMLEGRQRVGRIPFADEHMPGVWLWSYSHDAPWHHNRLAITREQWAERRRSVSWATDLPATSRELPLYASPEEIEAAIV